LGRIIQAFKSLTTNAYIRGVNQHGWPTFPGLLWQRNYYERVIRDEEELTATRAYIRDNPAWWGEDAENPERIS
jgi:REP element-mobilizing transposase RayT